MDLYSHIKTYLSEVESIMESDLQHQDERIYGMLIPFIKRGGKRIRPALCLLSCGAVGGKYDDVVTPASVIELFHNFTLIHDDIEDDSRFRRGEPTLHVSYGIPIALNSGDALYTFLWKKLISFDMEETKLIKLQKLYAASFKRVVDGQGIELSWIHNNRFDVSESEYLQMINGKTSALMGLSCEIGVFLGGGDKKIQNTLREYGEKLGTAFQVQDDVLNVIGDFKKYKKEIGGDISEGKRTIMVVHCLNHSNESDKKQLLSILASHSKKQADISTAIKLLEKYGSIEYAKNTAISLVEDAKKCLSPLKSSKDKKTLEQVADYVITRET